MVGFPNVPLYVHLQSTCGVCRFTTQCRTVTLPMVRIPGSGIMTPSLRSWGKVFGKPILLIILLLALRNQIHHRYTDSPSLSRIDILVWWWSYTWNRCAWLLLLSQMVHSVLLKLCVVRNWLTQLTPPTMLPSLHLSLHSSRPPRIPANHGTCQPLIFENVIGSTCLHGLLCPTIIGHPSRLNWCRCHGAAAN